MLPALIVIVAYLLGSIPFGYLIVRFTQGTDIRQSGSGGTGATNVSRRAGKAAGVVTLLLDALKGAGAVFIATSFLPSPSWWIAIAAIAVLLGHIFPIWLGFRGGKGVATGVGVFLMLAPFVVAVAGVLFLVVVVITRYVSLGSIVAALSIPALLWLQHRFVRPNPAIDVVLLAALAGAALILFAHRANIQRLIGGTEHKFR